MRLKKRPRVDALDNEARARKGSLGRWLYLGAIAAFVIWLGDLFAGELVYFKADGLVLRDRVVIATQYPASVESISVAEGEELRTGQPLLTIRSQSVEETLAELSSELAILLTRAADMRVRAKVNEAIAPVVQKNLLSAQAARANAENGATRNLFTVSQRATLFDQELSSVRADAQVRAERIAIAADLPSIEAAVQRAERAISRLSQNYAEGALRTPTTGVVGYLHVAPGSVVSPGDPIMEIFHGEPYVLAFVPEGALYSLQAEDEVNVRLGFDQHDGKIERIYPVTAELPPEFADRFNQQRRAPLAKIRLTSSDTPPTLFARTRVTAKGWPPAWFKRLLGIDQQAPPSQPQDSEEDLLAAAEPTSALSQLVASQPAATAAVAKTIPASIPAAVQPCGNSALLYWLEDGQLKATRLSDGAACSTEAAQNDEPLLASAD